MISKESETAISGLLAEVHKMILEIEASNFKVTNEVIIERIRFGAIKVNSIAESRDQIDGVCFEDISGGFRVYNWHDKKHNCHYIMFDDLKNRNIFDRICAFFGRKIIKPLQAGLHYGRYHVAGRYVDFEIFIDYLREKYPDVLCWVLFNPEIFQW